MNALQYITLGTIQGIAEWLPVSSEGVITLVSLHFFGGKGLGEAIRIALFLHLGTFFAALVYFRQDVGRLLRGLFRWREAEPETRVLLIFLIVATVTSGALGYAFLNLITFSEALVLRSAAAITALIGALLIITGALQLRRREAATREAGSATAGDGALVGLAQALAALPGLSRSGLTVAALLFKKFKEDDALRMSFLLSLPIVLAGNIVLNWGEFAHISFAAFLGLVSSFAFGLLTIHWFLRIAQRINFGVFVIGFGVLMLAAALL